MAVGFRKSLFGFNSDDVMQYIEKTHKTFSKKEAEFNEKIDELNSTLTAANEAIENIKAEKAELEIKLKEFTDKQDEIERLSQNIGKLYLVAQANAKSVMENAEQNSELAKIEVQRNISAVNEAQNSLNELKAEIILASDNFSKELDRLVAEFNKTKTDIIVNTSEIDEKLKEFDSVFEGLKKQNLG